MPTEVSPDCLLDLIATPVPPLIVDVRTDDDFAADPRLLPRSVRRSHHAVSELPLDSGPVVTLCQKGRKLSQGAAALIGTGTRWLAEGSEGWNGPSLRADRLPASGLWAAGDTGDGVVADWLVARFAPPGHRVLRVRAEEVAAVADRFGTRSVEDASALPADLGLDWSPVNRLMEELRAPAMASALRGAASLSDMAPDAGRGLLDALFADLRETHA